LTATGEKYQEKWWTKLCNEELYALHYPPDIIVMITSRKMRRRDHRERREGGGKCEKHAEFWS
jgi:hypothetical protein